MQISEIAIIGILTFTALVFLLISLFVSYLRIVRKYIALKEGEDQGTDVHTIIARAQFRAQKILEEASLQRKEIISKSQEFLEKEQASLIQELEKSNALYAKKYEEVLKILEDESLRMLRNIPNEIKMFMISAIDGFRASLVQSVGDEQKKVVKILQESLIQAQHEIEKYKEARKREIDERALELVGEVTKRVLNRQISLDEHEKLVLKALDEAKRQGIL